MNQRMAVTSRVMGAGLSVITRLKNLSRRNVILIAVAVVAVGLAFNSGGLVAVGIPSLLIAFLPCIAMCALGMCKKGDGSGSSCSKSGGAESAPKTLESH